MIRLVLFISCLLCAGAVAALESVTVQLKWKHQFQFAGYYAAQQQGYYSAAGLEVTLLEAKPETDTIESVLSGRADFGVSNSELLLKHQQGAPVVAIAAIYQHSPLALVSLAGRGISNIHDLVGKKLMIHPSSVETLAYLSREGISERHVELLEHSYDLNDLRSGKVAAMTMYLTDAPYQLALAGEEVILFRPSMGGFDFYSDILFTTGERVQSNPETVQAFREATLKGWTYAMDNPEQIVDLIKQQYAPEASTDQLRFEAKMMGDLVLDELVEPGYMHLGRWRHIAETYASLGLIAADYDLSGFLFTEPEGPDLARLQKILVITLLVMLTGTLFCAYIYRLNFKLKANQAWLNTIVSNAPSALIQMDMDGRVISWNRQAETTFGWTKEEVMGRSVFDFLVPPEHRQAVQLSLAEATRNGYKSRSENWNYTRSGEQILCDWHNAIPQQLKDRRRTVIAMAIDITEQKQMEEKLRQLAHTDPLTGAHNRAFFYDQFEQMLKLAKRQSRGLAVMFVDLDDFKQLNDSHGHACGDQGLRIVVERIRDVIRESDIVARLGGDEFAVLLYDCESPDYAQQVGDKLLQALKQPMHLAHGEEYCVGASIGISIFPDHGDSATTLIREADKTMYAVKHTRKGKVLLSSS